MLSSHYFICAQAADLIEGGCYLTSDRLARALAMVESWLKLVQRHVTGPAKESQCRGRWGTGPEAPRRSVVSNVVRPGKQGPLPL